MPTDAERRRRLLARLAVFNGDLIRLGPGPLVSDAAGEELVRLEDLAATVSATKDYLLTVSRLLAELG